MAPPSIDELAAVAAALAAPGKGLLASDESTGTIGKRLEKGGIENTAENRRAYRELLYTAPGIGGAFSGVIMFKETLGQCASDGTPFVEVLRRAGVMAGIKVDEGLVPLEGGEEGETSTRGLETLEAACRQYVAQGARFAKWRAALRVEEGRCPSDLAVKVNAEQLAEYAAICQAAGLVPIVEPELLIDGPHSAETFAAASEKAIAACVAALWRRGVALEACLLKPQMVVQGTECSAPRAAPEQVAAATLRVMRRVVPPAVAGIMFLSGGQTEEEATRNLDAINKLAKEEGRAPWSLSFSFGRGLQASVLKIWSNAPPSRASEARAMAGALAEANAAAARGEFAGRHPSVTSAPGATLHETWRGWRTDVDPAAAPPPAPALALAGV
ncbi:fructose-1,6-bisphosphate aldolase [Raphidocelis subcapitata]|uniref:fructose-bisphosphate aldolase n=1 Tax=Raphidocelis subcapitata TaxID=307507 RepID=A0A2V0NT17_9CHLO|nr:fructose-1,6-bisphosphate aldolase [Raphidocelis subcapitata]|eukprot:GBF90781.1 fructose-1,6-bisphosphate aldolase [Raphidocelis subcapitata]